MIPFKQAHTIVLENTIEFGTESVSLANAVGRILAEPIYADRDFPPFDRVTKDGIAINFTSHKKGNHSFAIQEIAAAGAVQKTLVNPNHCIEVMTGAMLPKGTDTVVMYEHLQLERGVAKISVAPKNGQNIHKKGSDEPKGSLLLEAGLPIGTAEIGVLATVGKTELLIKKLPKVGIISTGNELVNVEELPAPHQIRKSNSWALQAALNDIGVRSELLHFQDSKEELVEGLKAALVNFDVLLLSGGVSKGKFDYLPEVLTELGVEKLFHKVKQRPGKPFWFGKNDDCTLFAFPGNPASTFANYHIYFLPWFAKSLGFTKSKNYVVLNQAFENDLDLNRFVLAKTKLLEGTIKANLVQDNGSGDLTSLARADGLISLEPNTKYKIGELVPFYPTKRVL